MNMPANTYAIGPSLYDWKREEWEEQAIKRDIEDARFETYFPIWQRMNYCDLYDVKTANEEVSNVMGDAMLQLSWNKADSDAFELLMFKFVCSDSTETNGQMITLLLKYIKPACRELMKEAWKNW